MKNASFILLCLALSLTAAAAAPPAGGGKCELCAIVPRVTPGTPFYSLAKEFHRASAATLPGPGSPGSYCYWHYDYDINASVVNFWEALPSSRWALKIMPFNYCTVWVAEFHFDIKKNSLAPKQDTLEVQVQEANSPYSLIFKQIFLINPNQIESLYPLYPPLGAPYSTGYPIVNTKRYFLLTAKFRGPSIDSVKWFFKSPSQNPSSYRFVNNTTLQSASQAVGQSVDLYWGAEICAHVPLPIELTAFSAERHPGDVLLSWETAAEVNNYGFRIQRAPARAGPWEDRGFVPGKGNSAVRQTYSFDDLFDPARSADDAGQDFWYRLVQMDYDGSQEEYTPLLVAAAASAEGIALGQNYPNPFGASSASGSAVTTFQYSLPDEKEVELTVSDAFGRTLAILEKGRKNGGTHAVQWMARDLAAGTYFIRLTAGTAALTRKFILLR